MAGEARVRAPCTELGLDDDVRFTGVNVLIESMAVASDRTKSCVSQLR